MVSAIFINQIYQENLIFNTEWLISCHWLILPQWMIHELKCLFNLYNHLKKEIKNISSHIGLRNKKLIDCWRLTMHLCDIGGAAQRRKCNLCKFYIKQRELLTSTAGDTYRWHAHTDTLTRPHRMYPFKFVIDWHLIKEKVSIFSKTFSLSVLLFFLSLSRNKFQSNLWNVHQTKLHSYH